MSALPRSPRFPNIANRVTASQSVSYSTGFEHPEGGSVHAWSTARRNAKTSQDSVLRLARAAAELVSAAGEPAPGGRPAECRRGLARYLGATLLTKLPREFRV